jgi:ABC-type multidrug transport system ATPase subunit
MRQRFGIAQALLGDPKLIIVDEPTAGLDPEECNRFQNLLAEISENVTVILSTHIVNDVSVLCSQVAIMDGGLIAAHGAPADLVKSFEGKIWRKVIDKSELDAVRARHQIISTRLSSGRRIADALSDADPGDGFEPVQTELEHVYFAILARRRAKPEVAAASAAV